MRRAEPIYGGQLNREEEIKLLLRAPSALAFVAGSVTSHHVAGPLVCLESQWTTAMGDLDWIEYLPERS